MVGGGVGFETCRLEERSVVDRAFKLLANILTNSLAHPPSETSRATLTLFWAIKTCCKRRYDTSWLSKRFILLISVNRLVGSPGEVRKSS